MITYNHQAYLARAIEGVLNQQLDYPLELIIGEDCSTDQTRKIALDYQQRYPRSIRVLTSETNVGMMRNHYRTMMAARGTYVAFCEGDDFWHRSDKLRKQVAVLEAEPEISLVCTNYRVVSSEGEVLDENHLGSLTGFGNYLSYEDLVLDRVFVPTLTACTRRDLLHSILQRSQICRDISTLMGDLPLWLELSQLGRIHCLPEPLASYCRSTNSATRQKDPLSLDRFTMNASDISFRFLSLYPLPEGASKTRRHQILLARSQLQGAAWVGAPEIAETQWERLKSLGEKPGWRDLTSRWLAHCPAPRRSIAKLLQSLRRTWFRLPKPARSSSAGIRPE